MADEPGQPRQPKKPDPGPTLQTGSPLDEARIAIPTYEGRPRPIPGQAGVIMLGLSIGILLMGMQLWLLTLAFDLYLAGETGDTLAVAFWSGLVFVGGLVMLRILDRGPHRAR